MEKRITFVGLDAHKETIRVAVLLPGASKAVEWQLVNEKAAVPRMLRKVERLAPGEVRLCYEAGLWLCAAALDPGGGVGVHGGGAVVDSAQARGPDQDRPA